MHERCDMPCGELTRLERRIDEYEAQSNSSRQQLDERLRAVEMQNAVQDEKYSTILSKIENLTHSTEVKIDKLTEKAEAMAEKPGKRWETLVVCIITAVCTAICGYFLRHLGIF